MRGPGQVMSGWWVLVAAWAWALAGAVAPLQAQVDAITQARYDLKLALTVDGKVGQVAVKPGDVVEQGQLLLELEDQEGKALVDLWKLKADSDLDVKTKQKQFELAELEESMLTNLHKDDAANPQELRRAELNAQVAQLNVQTSQQEQQEARYQYDQARARHERYLARAPRAGVIETVTVEEGESVEANKPVLRLVVTDPLLVEAWVPLEQSLALRVSDPAWLTHRLPGHETPVQGKIISIGQVAESGSQTRLVRIELPNPGRLPAGGHVDVRFTAPPTAVSQGPGAAGAPGGTP